MKVFWFGTLLVAALGAGGFGGCTHTPTPDPNIGPAPPFVSGTYDCGAASTWTTSTFAGLVPAVQRAVANDNPENALTGLLRAHAAQEVTCVAGYVHDESVKQQASRDRQGPGHEARRRDPGLARPAVGARPDRHQLHRRRALMPEFALVAQDNCVPPDVLAFIAAAVNLQMQRDVAPVWGGDVWTCIALDSLDGVAVERRAKGADVQDEAAARQRARLPHRIIGRRLRGGAAAGDARARPGARRHDHVARGGRDLRRPDLQRLRHRTVGAAAGARARRPGRVRRLPDLGAHRAGDAPGDGVELRAAELVQRRQRPVRLPQAPGRARDHDPGRLLRVPRRQRQLATSLRRRARAPGLAGEDDQPVEPRAGARARRVQPSRGGDGRRPEDLGTLAPARAC